MEDQDRQFHERESEKWMGALGDLASEVRQMSAAITKGFARGPLDQDNGSWKAFALMAFMVGAMLLAVVRPAYISAEHNSNAIIRIMGAMADDDNRERLDAAGISHIPTLRGHVTVLDEWMVEHKAQSAEINGRQNERIKALERQVGWRTP